MAVSEQPTSLAYTTDGTTVDYPFTSYFMAAADLIVTLKDGSGAVTTKVLNTDYTVTGAQDDFGAFSSGAAITMLATPATGQTLRIARRTPRTQPVSFTANDPFSATDENHALDRMVLIIQEFLAGFQGITDGPPTDGTYAVGDWFRLSAVAGGAFGIVCTAAGLPGTWKEFGAISL